MKHIWRLGSSGRSRAGLGSSRLPLPLVGSLVGCLAFFASSLVPSAVMAQEPEEAEEAPVRRGFLAMPHVGVGIPVGDSGDGLDPGFRVGALLGGRLNSEVSLNGELVIDVLNPKTMGLLDDLTAVMVDLTFSPLFHFGTPSLQGFVGPKLGVFLMSASAKGGGSSADGTAQGVAYGFNAGFAVPVGKVALGGLLSYTGRHATEACVKSSGGSEICDDSPSGDDFKSLSLSAALLF